MLKYNLKKYIGLLEASNLIKEIKKLTDEDESKEVDLVTYDSRQVTKGTLFICKGVHFKEEYLKDAISKGAFAYVAENEYKGVDGVAIIVKDIRKAMGILANQFYNYAWKNLKLIGLTGTKGKSTTAYYVKSIIDSYMKSKGEEACAIISSIDTDDGLIKEESHITTPEALVLHKHFANAVTSGRKYLVMEVSSQGLRYDRTLGVNFNVGTFLNIGLDHISSVEHKDFEDYFTAKLMLLDQCEKACINIDGDHMDKVIARAKSYISFGTSEKADIWASEIESLDDGIEFLVKGPDFQEKIKLAMTGLFNVENALAAIASCLVLEIPMNFIRDGLSKATAPGRMELFTGEKTGVRVIVDYAHNKMSFESLFKSTREEYPDKKIFAIYGCPGSKAQARRWELSEVAGKYSAKIYITEEDHGEEDLMKISKEIAGYVEKTGCPYQIENDREMAIKKAIEEADRETVILLTGKGRETRQKRGMDYVETPSDVDFVLKYLK